MIYDVLINTITNSNISWESRSKYAEITKEQTQPTAIQNIQLLPHNSPAGIICQKSQVDLERKGSNSLLNLSLSYYEVCLGISAVCRL